ncbi:DUF6250 domain-containing protein [Marinoscillum furvescens]|uniref:DUF6250 domain-containing protein n=1 Tax=Marinoscillum furvescens DSM 4134 TaxID=1122208 RepID=A0A3D9L7E0_MARFU|nr:DUF6250 domain-containing protein [Marinoscillum furvescens]REE01992.1 hypothetical protein C7460_10210 [Marinoscillum furvescens DSM 4134]
MTPYSTLRTKFCTLTVSLVALFAIGCQEQKEARIIQLTDDLKVKAELIHSDDFSEGISNWKVEQMPKGSVYHKDGKLEVNDWRGCTVWFKEKLEGPIMIEYDAVVLQDTTKSEEEDGIYDRASDLNCFWMATDSENPDNLFANSESRSGKFTNYNSLSLYYTGMGGHFNTKTRFRRYSGNGEKPLLPEHDLSDPKYLITPNQLKQIRLVAYDGVIQYYRNGELIYDYRDPNPYTEGHFGLRTVHNHMTLDNFKVYRLTKVDE